MLINKFPHVPAFFAMCTILAFSSPAALSKASESKEDKPNASEEAVPEKKPTANPEKKRRAPKKRPVIPSDYGRWESLRQDPGGLSENGRWLAYTVARVDKALTA